VSPKFSRLVLVASVALGLGLAPLLGALASTSVVTVQDDQFLYSDNTNTVTVYVGDEVTWRVAADAAHAHTVTPFDGKSWGTDVAGNADDLTAGKEYTVKFNKASGSGGYIYYCKNHGGGDKLHPTGMFGKVVVIDPTPVTTATTAPPTTTTTTAPATTTTTKPAVTTPTTPAPAGVAATHPPTTVAPAPTTTTKPEKDKKDNKDNKDETTTTTAPPPPVAPDLPDSAIVPALPGFETGTLTQDGAEAPGDNPTGEAVALLKNKHKGGDGMKLLILSGFGLGALGFGTAGYKYHNRSSKYFPA